MVPLVLAFRGLRRAVAAVWRDPETKALPFVAAALLLTRTIFYWRAEDWTIVQALYFSVGVFREDAVGTRQMEERPGGVKRLGEKRLRGDLLLPGCEAGIPLSLVLAASEPLATVQRV